MGIAFILPMGKNLGMDKLLTYLNGLPKAERQDFVARCGTSEGYLRKAISMGQRIGEGLCIAIDRESGAAVRCEDIRPDVDWIYLRAPTAAQPKEQAHG